jgi:citrate lyase subunit beta/citryl-CoA lyase
MAETAPQGRPHEERGFAASVDLVTPLTVGRPRPIGNRGFPPRARSGTLRSRMVVRPRRSVLYVPGSNRRALEKARTLDADALILDLEDAVAPSAKEAARRDVGDALRAGGFGHRELALRVNGPATPWGPEDLALAARAGADAVVLPKVESADEVRAAERALDAAGAPAALALWCMIETPRGVLASAAIAAATPRLACLVMGTSDLVKDLRARHTPGRAEVLFALGAVLLAARAAGLAALDGVHLDLSDDVGLEASCRQGRDLGFDGKTLVHPRTVEVANRVFAPAAAEVERARRVIAAHAEAQAAGRGVVVVDGRLVEALHVEEARRIVGLAEAIAARAAR